MKLRLVVILLLSVSSVARSSRSELSGRTEKRCRFSSKLNTSVCVAVIDQQMAEESCDLPLEIEKVNCWAMARAKDLALFGEIGELAKHQEWQKNFDAAVSICGSDYAAKKAVLMPYLKRAYYESDANKAHLAKLVEMGAKDLSSLPSEERRACLRSEDLDLLKSMPSSGIKKPASPMVRKNS